LVNRSLSDWNKLVLNVREVVAEVNAFDLWDNISGDFDLGPSVDFNSHVFLDDVGMSVSDGNVGSLFDNIELTILSDQDGATMLITDNAVSGSVDGTLVSSSLSGDVDTLDLKVHGNSSTWGKIGHVDVGGFFENDWFLCYGGNWLLLFLILLWGFHIDKKI
tara:strand:- start:58 stop:543 length:486 start_codon:yes stop_codon:yes gene_type:complete